MEEGKEIIAECTVKDLSPAGLHDRADEVAEKVMQLPQAPCPVIHRFSPGLYIREIRMPAGAFVIGHIHKHEHFNTMLKGHLVMVNEDGSTTNMIAPQSFTSKPGRKIAYIIEDVVWQNIYPTDETDIDVLESMYLVKTERFLMGEKQRKAADRSNYEAERFSYKDVLERYGMTEIQVRKISDDESTFAEFSGPVHPYRLSDSPIEGRGYFLTLEAKAGTILAPARVDGKRTPAGRYVNHSRNPNAQMQNGVDGNLYLVAIRNIDGCMGGSIGTEVTTDYSETINLLEKVGSGDKLCHTQ